MSSRTKYVTKVRSSGLVRIEDLDDGTVTRASLVDFCEANREGGLCSRVRRLKPGQHVVIGGGAAPAFRITRVSVGRAPRRGPARRPYDDGRRWWSKG